MAFCDEWVTQKARRHSSVIWQLTLGLSQLRNSLGLQSQQDKTRQWWETDAGRGASISVYPTVSLLYTRL